MAELPPPPEGIVLAHFIVSDDVERSRRFYTEVLGGRVVYSGPGGLTYVALSNSWIIINVGGGPTDDKPAVTLETPRDPGLVSSFLNIRVKDIPAVYAEWSARGAEFLTPPKQSHGHGAVALALRFTVLKGVIDEITGTLDGKLLVVPAWPWDRVPGRCCAAGSRLPLVTRRSCGCLSAAVRTTPCRRTGRTISLDNGSVYRQVTASDFARAHAGETPLALVMTSMT